MDGESNKKPFTFDFSYDSMDTFNPNYASQDQVLCCMESECVDGIIACLFMVCMKHGKIHFIVISPSHDLAC